MTPPHWYGVPAKARRAQRSGETARVLEAQGDWRRVRLDLDRYEGWVHRGYALETDHEVARGWRDSAGGWSEGAVVRTEDGVIVRLPIRARVGLAHPRVDLPDGRRGTVIAGEITPYDRVIARARAVSPRTNWVTCSARRFGSR